MIDERRHVVVTHIGVRHHVTIATESKAGHHEGSRRRWDLGGGGEVGIRTAHAHAWQYDGGSGSGGGGDGENGGDGRGGDHCVVAQRTSVCRRRWRRQTRTSATVHDSFMAPARNGIAAAGTVLL